MRVLAIGISAVVAIVILVDWQKKHAAPGSPGACRSGCAPSKYGAGGSSGAWPSGPAYLSTAATNDISTGSAGGDEDPDSPIRKCPATINKEGWH